ncbi:hypothetical protein QZH41_003709 [Actinostola sp. cb2023]|nr:hypothetical protein QZH41_003709 [Actinostola sp. cb2023]
MTKFDLSQKNKLSTSLGVVVPVILSMFSVILFLRVGFVVGQFYVDMISRTLGPEFGGSIGVIFFFANVFSSALYILGFVEALVNNFGPAGTHAQFSELKQDYEWKMLYGTCALLVCCAICLLGAGLFAKTSFIIFLAVLIAVASSLVSFFIQKEKLIPPASDNPLSANIVLFIGNVNKVAPLVSMFFLLCYGVTNLACFALKVASAPNFRFVSISYDLISGKTTSSFGDHSFGQLDKSLVMKGGYVDVWPVSASVVRDENSADEEHNLINLLQELRIPAEVRAQIADLKKKLDDRDETLCELSEKLAKKSEECGDVMDERDTMRKRISIDLQQVTKEYMELQDQFKEEQRKTTDAEKNYREEQERLQLELDVSKGDHELELSMLRKEIIAIRNKSQQRGIPLDVETDRLRTNYESEILSLKDQLEEQTEKTREAMEKLEQQEFELLELNESKKQEQKHEVIVAEHEAEMAKLRRSYENQSEEKDINSNSNDKVLSELLRKEHEVYVQALKEQYDADLLQLKTQIQEMSKQSASKETEVADDMMTMRKAYEIRLESLETELEQSREELGKVAMAKDDAVIVEELKLHHDEEMNELKVLHSKEIQRLRLESQRPDSEEDISKSNLENELQQKRYAEAYEHEIRSLKAELKKERLDFTEAREMLESNITDMEHEMKTREEKMRWELKEEHKYELENLVDEHEQLLHEKQKTHKHELAELKRSYEARLACTNEDEKLNAAVKQQKQIYETEIEELKMKYDGEIENLQDTLESLQMEHEELQTEYDLVVNDLASELETTKLRVKGDPQRRRSSGVLMEGIGKLKSHNEEHVQHLTAELREAQRIISSLDEEVATLKSHKKASLEHSDKVTKLEKLVKKLELDKEEVENSAALQKQLDDCKLLIDKLQNEGTEIHSRCEKLQEELNFTRKDKEAEMLASEKKTSELKKQADEFQNDKHKIEQQMDREIERFENQLDKIRNDMQQELSLQNLSFEEKLAELKTSNEELESDRQTLEEENQQLRDQVEDLQTATIEVEPHIIANESFSICSENIDMIGDDEAPEPTEELKNDQRMKGIVEDFENRIAELQVQLTKANQELSSRNSRLQSVHSEMNVLRGTLEDERNSVQNVEDRCQKLLQSRDLEIEKMRKKFETGTAESVREIAARESRVLQECDVKVDTFRSELTKAREDNHKLTKDTEDLRKELENIEQQLIEQEATHLAEKLKQTDSSSYKVDSLEEEIDTMKERLRSVTSTLEAERSEHERKLKETEFLVEQLKQTESNGARVRDLIDEVQKQQEENASLRSELATERDKIARRSAEFQKENRTKSSEIESLASMVDTERHTHKQKIEQLGKEMKEKDDEVTALSSMLEKEQTNHERTINDTKKHFDKLQDLENNNDELDRENVALKTTTTEMQTKSESMERETTKLKKKLKDLKAELSKMNRENDDLLFRSKQMTMDEMEEVQKLNHSLTQVEIHKEKLLDAVESSKQELQKTQGKYHKTKDKLKTVTQKWQKDHSKLEEILLSPRVDMGLQTSLLEPAELDDAKSRLSDSMRMNERLEGELKDSKQGLHEFKNDIQAMKRANKVLIRQNQVLYLETEALKKTVEEFTRKADQLREVSVKLTKDNETFERENKELKENLETTELNLSQAEGEKSSFDALSKTSQLELEERRINCRKNEEDNDRLINQNEFLLSQAKRLQSRVDDLEGDVKQLKNDLLIKEVDLLKKERLMSDFQTQSVNSSLLVPASNLQRVPTSNGAFQMNGIQSKESEVLESRAEENAACDGFATTSPNLVSRIKSLKESVGNGGDGDKGYVGIKSYQGQVPLGLRPRWDRDPITLSAFGLSFPFRWSCMRRRLGVTLTQHNIPCALPQVTQYPMRSTTVARKAIGNLK